MPDRHLHVRFRVRHADPGHTHVDLFVGLERHGVMPNPGNAGRIILRTDEYDAVREALRQGGATVDVVGTDPRGA
jgi:hypothetical protein